MKARDKAFFPATVDRYVYVRGTSVCDAAERGWREKHRVDESAPDRLDEMKRGSR